MLVGCFFYCVLVGFLPIAHFEVAGSCWSDSKLPSVLKMGRAGFETPFLFDLNFLNQGRSGKQGVLELLLKLRAIEIFVRIVMGMNLYVGNLPYSTSEDDLKEVFSEYGEVIRTAIIMDRELGRSKGYGFVEMVDGGDQAIEAMNGTVYGGRTIKVNEARPRQEHSRS